MKNKFLYTIALSFLAALCLPSITQSNSLFFPQEVCAQDTELSDSEVLVARWQHLLDTTGKLHIPFNVDGLCVRMNKGVCVYEVSDNLHVQPSDQFTISSDPRVQVVYSGERETGFIEIDEPATQSPWTGYRLKFHDLRIQAKGEFTSCIKTTMLHAQLPQVVIEDCNLNATGYTIDFNDIDYSKPFIFNRITTGGGGALRLCGRQNGGAGARYWAQSQTTITNWHHNGKDRVGPAFDLCGVGGLIMANIIDEQHRQLHPLLIEQGWTGPISLRIDTPKFPNVIRNYWCEAVKGQAPGCWVFEYRATDISSVGKENTIDAYSVGYHGGSWPFSEHTTKVIGGSSSAERPDGGKNNGAQTQSIIVRFHNSWQPTGEEIATHGKAEVQFFRPLFQGLSRIPILQSNYYVEGIQKISTHHKPSIPDGPSHQVSMDKDNDFDFYPASDSDLNWKPAEPDPIGPEDGSGIDSTKQTGDQ